ncbi:LysR family transcriptional regulator YnfL [Dickeya aquatica]|uniref:LysR family transcriptional regulator YnfL n=1 Tax=Dickeya aquatica TaxID=1401087 RepID=A0A375AAV2_9GAMM|nr:LysR family transcriptional regulator YnfL [Dickeya aquatica]
MNIELRHLRYFIAVAEELHFGRAAEKLHISQPPLSQQIQILEEQLGAQLLERNNRNVRLTQAGAQFLKEAWAIIHQVNQAAERAGVSSGGNRGVEHRFYLVCTLCKARVAWPVTISSALSRRSYPDAGDQHQTANCPLLDGKLDLGVMRNNPLPDMLHHQLLLHEPMVAVVHEEHPLASAPAGRISIQHLAQEPFVFFAREVGTALYDEVLTLLKKYGITPYITQEVGEAMTIIGLVSAGLGVSLLPASFCRIRVDGVKYLSLQQDDAISEMWVSHRQRPLNTAAQTLITLMLASSTKNMCV